MNYKEFIIPIGEEAKEFDEMFIGVIRKQPELIRCNDCFWYRKSGISEEFDCTHLLGIMYPKPTDFCSHGEKRENDSN